MTDKVHRPTLLRRLATGASMPLLVRELTRQAARKRTYVFRVILILTALAAAIYGLKDVVTTGSPNQVLSLGQGKDLFWLLVGIQYVITYVFLPAYCAGLITSEKEHDTLQLLLVTKISPTSIILEKSLSRLVPFASLLAIGAPVLAVAYSHGGITQPMVWCTAYLGLSAAAQVSAMAILCSVWFRRTVTAFVATYVLAGILLWFGPLTLAELFDIPPSGPDVQWHWQHFPLYHQLHTLELVGATSAFVHSWPVWVTTVSMLLTARMALIPRAFAKPTNLLRRTFRRVDQSVEAVTGTQLRSDKTIPTDEPIAWRETTRGMLGNTRYQLYSLAVVSILILGTYSILLVPQRRDALVAMQIFAFALGALLITAKGSSLFSQERASQTLDVLLTIPMRNSTLMLQKFRGLRNLIAVLTIILLLLGGLYVSAMTSPLPFEKRRDKMDVPFFGLCHLSTLVLYPQVIAWLSICVGMRIKRVLVALVTVLTIVIAWCFLPLVVHDYLTNSTSSYSWNSGESSPSILWNTQSPLYIPMSYFRQDYRRYEAPWGLLLLNIVYYGVGWFALRKLALSQLSKRLGRRDQKFS